MVLMVQISGFLGSGKTTTIIKLATAIHEKTASRVAVIVNEIGDVDVDGELVKSSGLYSKRLLGGCICCSLGKDLVSTIKLVIEEFDPEILFVEPTGVALPSQVKSYFVQASYIQSGLEFSPVVTLVDGPRFKFLLQNFRSFFTKQMRDADILVVTKIDKLDKKFELPLITSALREMHPSGRIISISSLTGEGFDELMQSLISDRVSQVMEMNTIAEKADSLEGSEVGSADFYGNFRSAKTLDGHEIRSLVGELLTEIGLSCMRSGGNFIGHIKSYVGVKGSGFKASLVDISSGVEFTRDVLPNTDEFKISIFLAISGFNSKDLENILKKKIEAIGEKHDLSVEDLHHQK
jgi:G3E family GTPase